MALDIIVTDIKPIHQYESKSGITRYCTIKIEDISGDHLEIFIKDEMIDKFLNIFELYILEICYKVY